MEPLLNITKVEDGERLDVVLARSYPDYSRTFFQKLVRQGGVTQQGQPTTPNYRVHIGEKFKIMDFESIHQPGEGRGPEHAGLDVSFRRQDDVPAPPILFEDAAILVIDKPAGLVVHPGPGHRGDTLIDWLRVHLGSAVKVFTNPERLGLVHRLDKDTSGVLLIAKTIPAQTAVSRQFRDRAVKKTYAAFVEGIPSANRGVISAPVGRSRKVPTRMAVSSNGRPSETSFEVKQVLGDVAQLALYPKTGRTHQIRVHLAALGHPIVGDRTYGSKSIWEQSYGIRRPLLHAEKLEIQHPVSGQAMRVEAPWPADFRAAEKAFRKAAKGVVALLLLATFSVRCASAADGDATPAPASTASSASHATSSSSKASSSHLNSRISSLSSQVKELQKDMKELDATNKSLQSENIHLRDQLTTLQSNLDQLSAARRLSDLEHALSDLNAKAVGGATSGEEVKTQLMDISHKLKDEQDSLDQLRDQMDRVQRQMIQQKTRDDNEATPPVQPVPGK